MERASQRHLPSVKGRVCVVLCLILTLLLTLFCSGCRAQIITLMPDTFLERISTLCADDFGAVTVTEKIDAVTHRCQITDRITLWLYTDPVTGLVARAELALTFDADITDLDYASFSYFFLVMLKAYDPNISISNINSVHDALGIETYTAGTDAEIGFGSSTYYYTVSETEARFSAQYIVPAETLDL